VRGRRWRFKSIERAQPARRHFARSSRRALHGSWKASTHPLTRAVLKSIVDDEADHGTFGWTYLDWALPHLDETDRVALGATADDSIRGLRASWKEILERPDGPDYPIGDFGWMENEAYVALAERSLEKLVLEPLRERNVPCS
jgi:hypothetical protein